MQLKASFVAILVTAVSIVSITLNSARADSFQIIRDGKTYTCTEDSSGGGVTRGCDEASLDRFGFVTSDCRKVENDAQDICAGRSIDKLGFVTSDCFKLTAGGQCAVASIDRMGFVTSDCAKVKNSRQDRCAAQSIRRDGFVTSSCLSQ